MPERRRTRNLPDLSRLCVLVIDDNDDARELIAATIRYAGATVTTAAAGDHALDDLEQYLPDVIVCDLQMPRVDGLAFMRALRRRPPELGGQLPVIAITAFYEQYSVEEAVKVGFVAYLPKPINLERLCRLIAAVGNPEA
jgi:CheY-like chemotaxis protein